MIGAIPKIAPDVSDSAYEKTALPELNLPPEPRQKNR